MFLACNDNAEGRAHVPLPELNKKTIEMELYARKCIESCKALKRKLKHASDTLKKTEETFGRHSENLTHISGGLRRAQELSEDLYEILDDGTPSTTR